MSPSPLSSSPLGLGIFGETVTLAYVSHQFTGFLSSRDLVSRLCTLEAGRRERVEWPHCLKSKATVEFDCSHFSIMNYNHSCTLFLQLWSHCRLFVNTLFLQSKWNVSELRGNISCILEKNQETHPEIPIKSPLNSRTMCGKHVAMSSSRNDNIQVISFSNMFSSCAACGQERPHGELKAFAQAPKNVIKRLPKVTSTVFTLLDNGLWQETKQPKWERWVQTHILPPVGRGICARARRLALLAADGDSLAGDSSPHHLSLQLSNYPRLLAFSPDDTKRGPPAGQQRALNEAQDGFLHNCGVRRCIPGNQVWAEPAPLFRVMDLFPSASSIGPSPKLSPEAHSALFSRKHSSSLWASCHCRIRAFQKRPPVAASTSLFPLLNQPQSSAFSASNPLQSIICLFFSFIWYDTAVPWSCLQPQSSSYPYSRLSVITK